MNIKKNVLVADAFRETGGEEEVAFYIYDNLPRDFFNVYIAGPIDSPYFKKKYPKKEDFINIPFGGKFDFNSIMELRKEIKNRNIDIVNVHGYIAGYTARLACLGLRTKVVWTMHVNILDIPTIKYYKRKVRFAIEQFFNMHFTNQIICVANELKDSVIKKNLKTPVNVVYNGIDTEYFSQNYPNCFFHSDEDELILGFISRLSTQKGIEYLLSLAKELRNKDIKFKLLIIGEGDQENFVKEFIKQEKLDKFVLLFGFQQNVDYVLDSVDILILPSLFEGFPMIILEALCTGTPVIASNVNGVPEIIKNGENGFLVEPRNVGQLVSSTMKYYKDRNLISLHGQNGRKNIIDNFSKEVMIKNYQSIFDKL